MFWQGKNFELAIAVAAIPCIRVPATLLLDTWRPLTRLNWLIFKSALTRKRCVDDFPKSSRRGMVMEGLERMVAKLIDGGLGKSELWVDGSFLTIKEEPDDVDLVLFPPAQFFSGTEKQQSVLYWLDDKTQREAVKHEYHCHIALVPIYPEHVSMHILSMAQRLGFQDDFGHSYVTREPKGIGVIEVPQPAITPKKVGA